MADSPSANVVSPPGVYEPVPPHAPRWDWVWLVIAACVAHGATAIWGGAVFDDTMVLASPIVYDGLWGAVFHPVDYFELSAGEATWRPVATLSHMLDRALWGGTPFAPHWDHAMNVALHAGAVVALWALARAWGWTRLGALLAAAVFAVHPLATEAIGVVSFREEMLVAIFGITALWVLVPRRDTPAAQWGAAAVAAFCAFLACGAKEAALVLPAVALVAAWALPALDDESVRRRILRWTLPIAIGVGVYVPLRFVVYVAASDKLGYVGHPGGTPIVAALTMLWVASRYLAWTLWPSGLTVDHGVSAVRGVGTPLLGALVGVTAWSALGWWTWRRHRRAFVGWVWVGAFLLPVMDLVPLANIIAERYCYLPLAGGALLLGAGAAALCRGAARTGATRWALAGCACVLVGWTWRSATRAPDFASDARLFTAAATADPSSHRATYMQSYLLKGAPLTSAGCTAALARLDRVERTRGVPLSPAPEYREALAAFRAAVATFRDGHPDDVFAVSVARDRLAVQITKWAAQQAPAWSMEEAVMWLYIGIAEREWAETLLNRARPFELEISRLATEISQRERKGHPTDPLHRQLSANATQVQGLRPQAESLLDSAEAWIRKSVADGRMPSVMQSKGFENLGAIAGLRDPSSPDVRKFSEEALRWEPRRPYAQMNLGLYWEHAVERATTDAEREAAIDAALAAYEKAMDRPDTVAAAWQRWYQFRRQVRPLLPDSEEYEQILTRWEQLCDRFPTALDIRQALCRELVQLHKHDAADRNLVRALRWDPTWADGWAMRVDVATEVRPEGERPDPQLALRVLADARRYVSPSDWVRLRFDARERGILAGARQQELWKRKAANPDDYELFRDIGLNALDIPDYAVAREHLARARQLDPERFTREGHDATLDGLLADQARAERDDRLQKDGRPTSILLRAQEALDAGEIIEAASWMGVLMGKGDEAMAQTPGAADFLRRVRTATDLYEYGTSEDLVRAAQDAAQAGRWPEAAFFWRTVRERDPTAFEPVGGPAALAAAESHLARRH